MGKSRAAGLRVTTGLSLLVLMLLLLNSCGGGSEITTPIGNPADNTGNNGGNGGNGGNDGVDDPTIILPGGGKGHPFPFSPTITIPPVESYKDSSASGDSQATRWLKNCFEPTLVHGGTGVYQNASLQTWADQIFAGVNAERVKMGLPTVKRNAHMDELGQAMARDMALRDYFSHNTPEGLTPWDRYDAVSITPYNRAGEISAKGQENTIEVVTGWMNSPGHRAIIAIPELTHAGVGVYFDDSDYTHPVHIVMDFAQFPKNDPETWTEWYQRGDVYR
ncbi:CAP domain-containing protein [bacterium]|nr:CAP domain-containing protein [bacterium]